MLVRAHEEVVLEEAERFLRKCLSVCSVVLEKVRGLDSAACCDGLEVRRCGNDQHGCDMADLKMDGYC